MQVNQGGVLMFGKLKSNFYLDAAIFLAFLVTTITGLLLWLVLPEGRGSSAFMFLGLSKRTWTDIHDWAGVVMLAGASLHILLHWKWIICVGKRYFRRLARQARLYFTLDAFLFSAFFLANLTGLVAWLAFGEGGFQGGRNPLYNNLVFGLGRHDWNDLHRWSSLAIIAILAIHVLLHWKWVALTMRRYIQALPKLDDLRVSLGDIGGKSRERTGLL
jgi:hypothetical protein